jgi:hypothetical protein
MLKTYLTTGLLLNNKTLSLDNHLLLDSTG